jgi:hypothetical protein
MEMDTEIKPGKTYESIRRFGNKAAEHVLRIAGNLSFVDHLGVEMIETCQIAQRHSSLKFYNI